MGISERRERERRQRRRLILQAATAVFAESGLAGASMDAIARRAELGKATIYYYFSTKEQLYSQVVEAGTEAFFSSLSRTGRQPAGLDEAVEDLLRSFVAFCRQNPELLRVIAPFLIHIPCSVLGTGTARVPPPPWNVVHPRIPRAHSQYLERLRSLLPHSPWVDRHQELLAFLADIFLVLGHRALADQDDELQWRIQFYMNVVRNPPPKIPGAELKR